MVNQCSLHHFLFTTIQECSYGNLGPDMFSEAQDFVNVRADWYIFTLPLHYCKQFTPLLRTTFNAWTVAASA